MKTLRTTTITSENVSAQQSEEDLKAAKEKVDWSVTDEALQERINPEGGGTSGSGGYC